MKDSDIIYLAFHAEDEPYMGGRSSIMEINILPIKECASEVTDYMGRSQNLYLVPITVGEFRELDYVLECRLFYPHTAYLKKKWMDRFGDWDTEMWAIVRGLNISDKLLAEKMLREKK